MTAEKELDAKRAQRVRRDMRRFLENRGEFVADLKKKKSADNIVNGVYFNTRGKLRIKGKKFECKEE